MAGTTSEATLDMGLVGKVARTELRRIPTEAGVGANYDQAARAVAEAYLASYLKDGAETVARVDELVRADAPGGAFPSPLPDGQELTEEFAVGRTLAAAALEHARALSKPSFEDDIPRFRPGGGMHELVVAPHRLVQWALRPQSPPLM